MNAAQTVDAYHFSHAYSTRRQLNASRTNPAPGTPQFYALCRRIAADASAIHGDDKHIGRARLTALDDAMRKRP